MSKTATITILSSLIRFSFDPYLLLSPIERLEKEMHRIMKIAEKKIRKIDTGRKRDFENYLKQFESLYVRKKIEKAEYDTKAKKKAEERRRLSNEGSTCKFTRYPIS